MAPLIVFDLDGTLIDSRLDLLESANELLASLGAAPLDVDVVAGMVGDGARVLVGRVLAAAGITSDVDVALARFLDMYDQHLTVHTRLYPGVRAAIDAVAPRAALAVLTNKPRHHTERLLKAFDLRSRFQSVIGGDSGFPRKPDPASLLAVMANAGAAPNETLMVGDSMVDLETGRRAGVRVCGVGYGFAQFREGLETRPGEWLAASPADLEPALLDFLDDIGRR